MASRLCLESLRSKSIEDIGKFIGTLEGGQPLDQLPKAFARRFTHAWRIPVVFSDRSRDLLVLIDGDFPFSLPRIAVAEGPSLLDWPHLERHGLLCVVPGMASSSPYHLVEVLQSLLADACELIEHNIHGDTAQEFRDEFLSYWSYACDDKARLCISIVEPVGPSRAIAVWKGNSAWYFADTHGELIRWLEKRIGPSDKRPYETGSAWLVWRSEPWLPSEYPTSSVDLLQIMATEHETISVNQLVDDAVDGAAVLIGAPTDHGVCFAAVIHKPPGRSSMGPGRQGAKHQTKGFRPSKVPDDVLIKRAFSAGASIQKSDVSRADSAWIHGRDQDEHHDVLKLKRVAVVGCGSLGSEIVTLLAKAGVGNLTIVDGGSLEWANIGRHSLGAAHVSMNKATAMKALLAETLPHTNVDAVGTPLGFHDKTLIEKLMSADVLVSATGSWSAASLSNALWIDTGIASDMIVAWMEAHAIAAHSVHLSNNPAHACLQCGYSATGAPLLPVTQWADDPTLKVPACGGVFMPYGPVGLSRAAALAVEQCIELLMGQKRDNNHRIWVGEKKHLQDAGGEWSAAWLAEMGDPGNGGCLISRRWPAQETCDACGVKS